MEEVLGLILAGGQGSRMGVLCEERPKPILPFAGRFSVIDFSLSNCINSQITNLAALTDYQRQPMAEYLRIWGHTRKDHFKLSILLPKTHSYRGTADAVFQNLEFLDQSKAENVLILAGDHIYQMDYRQMLNFHIATKADATVGTIQVPMQEAHRFGTVCVDNANRIDEFAEKSSKPLSSLASMGIYFFKKDILVRQLKEDAARENSPHDFGYAILPHMVSSYDKVFAYEFSGYWQDIGTIKAYYEANMELLKAETTLNINNTSWPVFKVDKVSSDPEIGREGIVSNSLISSGCKIEGRVENSILSPGVHVGEQAVVRNSIVMANTKIGYHSVIDRCILDENVHIGKFCYVGFSGGTLSRDWDVTVIGKEAVVPPNTGIGRNVRVQSKVKPHDFIGGLVTSGTLISSRQG